MLGEYPAEVFGKVRYGLNALPYIPVWFGTNSIPVPNTSVASVRPPKIPRGELYRYTLGVPYRTHPCPLVLTASRSSQKLASKGLQHIPSNTKDNTPTPCRGLFLSEGIVDKGNGVLSIFYKMTAMLGRQGTSFRECALSLPQPKLLLPTYGL